ncbi:MAG: PIN domain-containing protein [Bacillota bacterium]|nr:PIN domain-containing protein [Bacillota bacterium]
MSIMVDTGAWYALASSTDRYHQAAKEFYVARIEDSDFVTTTAIVVETWALINARLGYHSAMVFWKMLRDSGLGIISVTSEHLEKAWVIARQYRDQQFSLTDCTTLAVMERLGITDVFAFDSHFLVYRFGPGKARSLTRLP